MQNKMNPSVDDFFHKAIFSGITWCNELSNYDFINKMNPSVDDFFHKAIFSGTTWCNELSNYDFIIGGEGYMTNRFIFSISKILLGPDGWLPLNVRGPSYLGLTRSISWLLMPWLLTSPGHQQPWYWLCRIGRFLSYLRKDFNYLSHINLEKWHKM